MLAAMWDTQQTQLFVSSRREHLFPNKQAATPVYKFGAGKLMS